MFKASHVCGLILFLFLLALCGPALAGHRERPPKKGILLVAFGTTVPEARTALVHIGEKAAQRFSVFLVYFLERIQDIRFPVCFRLRRENEISAVGRYFERSVQ